MNAAAAFEKYVSEIIGATVTSTIEKIERDSAILAKDPKCKRNKEDLRNLMFTMVSQATKEQIK
jgi:hypothetical protein